MDASSSESLVLIFAKSQNRLEKIRTVVKAELSQVTEFQNLAELDRYPFVNERTFLLLDLHDAYEEIFEFVTYAMKHPHIKLLFVGKLDHTVVNRLNKNPNLWTTIPEEFLAHDFTQALIEVTTRHEQGGSSRALIDFLNRVFSDLVNLAPSEHKSLVISAIYKSFESNLAAVESISFGSVRSTQLVFHANKLRGDLVAALQRVLVDIIETIDSVIQEDWGEALLLDALFQAVYKTNNEYKSYLLEFIKSCGFRNVEAYEKLNLTLTEETLHILPTQIGFLALEDLGPTLVFEESNTFGEIFDGLTSGQLISLVGQGELYHEGLFGPIPVSSNTDLMCIIYSKKLRDPNIKDERLKGVTLTLVAVAFEKNLIQKLPERSILESIFSDFKKMNEIGEVSIQTLANIQEKFIELIQN